MARKYSMTDFMSLRNEEKRIYEPLKRQPGDYTPANLRGVGTR